MKYFILKEMETTKTPITTTTKNPTIATTQIFESKPSTTIQYDDVPLPDQSS